MDRLFPLSIFDSIRCKNKFLLIGLGMFIIFIYSAPLLFSSEAIITNALTDELEKYTQLTISYATIPNVIITGIKERDDLKLSDLTGKRVAVLSGGDLEESLRNINDARFELVPMPDEVHALQATSFGQVDAYVENLASVSYHIQNKGIPNLRIAGTTGSVPIRIGISRKYPLLATAVQKAFLSIPAKDIENIRNRWISLKIDAGWSPETIHLLVAIIVFVVLLALVLVAIIYILRQRLREKVAVLEAARLKISEQTELLQLATEVTQAGFWDSRLDEEVIFFSKQWFSMLGYDREGEKMSSDNIKEFIHPDDFPFVKQRYHKYTASNVNMFSEIEFRLKKSDGGWCWILSKGKAVAWDENGVVTRIIGLDVNIQSIKDAQERLRTLFMSVPIPLVLLKSDGTISAINDAMIHTFGYTIEDIPDLEHWWPLAYRDKEYRYKVKSAWEKGVHEALANKVPVKAQEYHVTCKNGKVLRVRFNTNAFGEMIIVSLYEITELREKETALQESMERLRATLDATNDGIIVIDKDLKVIEANRQFYEMWRIPPDTPVTDNDIALRDLVKEQLHDPAGFMELVNELYASRRHDIFEILFKDGRVFDCYSASMTIAGEERGMVLDFRDITARKKAENTIDFERKKLRSIFGVMNDVVLICDIHGRLVEVVPTNTEFFYSLPDNIIGKTLWEIFPSEKADIFMDAIGRAISQNKPVRLDYELTIGGCSFWFAANISPMPPDWVVWVARDLTSRKLAEDQLRQSEEKFSKIFAMAPSIIAITRFEDATIIDVNNSFEDITGWEKSEAIGRTITDIHFWAEPTKLEDHIKELKARRDMLNQEVYFLCKDGRVCMGLYSARTIRISGTLSILSVVQDITEIKKIEADQQKLKEQLSQAQKMEAIGTLAGGVAHDFNNILGIIIGYTEMALNDMDETNPLRETFNVILDSAQRSANLTHQLLAFARKEIIEPVLFDINKAIKELLKMMQRLIGENIELRWLPGNGPLTVKLDPSQLDQIMANLCVNARDAIGDIGCITIETDLTAFDENTSSLYPDCMPGEYVMLSVSDNGYGMDSDTLKRIFEPFFTTKVKGKGTGMGLSTVYGIVHQNNGFINAYSEVGKGTSFKIYLPRNTEETGIKQKTMEIISESKGETLLLIEDDPVLLKMSENMLQRLGYKILSADTPTIALNLAQQTSGEIHMFITDVIMPEMTGRELAEKLKKARPGIRHLFMSGYTADVIAHHGVLEKGVNFIRKPFSLKTLADKVRSVLDQ